MAGDTEAARDSRRSPMPEDDARFRLLVEHMTDLVAVHCEGRIVFINQAGARMLGVADPQDLHGRLIWDFIHPEHEALMVARVQRVLEEAMATPLVETKLVALDGSIVDVEIIGMPTSHEGRPASQVVARNISRRKHAEALAEHNAYVDPLTGLPNRRQFRDRMQHAVSLAKHHDRQLAILLLDLDRFKNINDTLGHEIGDALLQAIARRLQETLHHGVFFARIGGDSFSVILSRVTEEQDAMTAANSLLEALEKPFKVSEHDLYVSASVGISHFPCDGEEPSELLMNAETAMYRAKHQRNTCVLYSSSMHEAALERLSLESRLHRAIEHDEFVLHYQPQVDLRTGEIVGAEALIRWHHPELGMVSPAKFIPLAEETGLILPITDLVLRKACRQAREWLSAGAPLRRMAVNLSGLYFKQREVTDAIAAVLAECDLPPSMLELEMTESIFMEDHARTLATLQTLRATGVAVSIDDFGTGYSSLSYLQRFPIGMLKIDQSFVREIQAVTDDAVLVKAIIGLAHSLGMRVIAEGVETEQQRAYLAAHGCDEIQGYLISRPVPPEAFQRLMTPEAERRAS